MSENYNKPKSNMPRFNLSWLYMFIAMTIAYLYFTSDDSAGINRRLTYTEFKNMVNKGYASKIIAYNDNTVDMFIKPEYVKEVFKDDYKKVGRSPSMQVEVGSIDALDSFLEKAQEEGHFTGEVSYEKKSDLFGAFFWNIAPIFFIVAIWLFIMRRMGGGATGGINPFSVGKSKAQVYEKGENANRITFKDVAGQEGAKQEVQEIVDFLKQPQKYTELGGKIPKGALLVGPPGTGKTLLAKAVAGEADVPFFSMSGSDFVEMFVGVGASRVRDLFKQAQGMAPCIVFIDEIDAIGKSRDSIYGGGNEEREQTLNQLLSEMDGFDTSKGIVILAATNRPEVLDMALLRPGRFDRRIIVDKPDLKGRLDTLKVHAKNVLMHDSVDLEAIALATSGAVGSDLANIINEAAILAVKEGRTTVTQNDLFESVETVFAGKEKKDRILGAEEKKIVAYHEVGHALVTALEKNAEPVQKITIVPRTMGALGYVLHVPEEEKYLMSKYELLTRITMLYGGRAAEELFFDTVTTGASNDIEKATELGRAMITQYGMSEKFGLIGLESIQNRYLDGRAVMNCADVTAAEVDHEVMELLKRCYERAKELLSGNQDVMERIASFLIEKETISGKEFMELFYELRPEAKAEAERKKAEKEAQKAAEETTATAQTQVTEATAGETTDDEVVKDVTDEEATISAEIVMESEAREEQNPDESNS